MLFLSLFNDILSTAGFIQCLIVNDRLGRVWKETIVVYFKVLS
jgi:hypothetical protein